MNLRCESCATDERFQHQANEHATTMQAEVGSKSLVLVIYVRFVGGWNARRQEPTVCLW